MESHESPSFQWRYAELDDSNFQIRGRTVFFILVLISIVIFISLVYLYAQWLCTRRGTADTTLQFPHAPPQSHPPSQGLHPNRISRIPIVLHQASSTGSEIECSICLGIFRDGEKVKVLPECSHCYHSECVDNWLKNQSTCPLCRSSLQADSLV